MAQKVDGTDNVYVLGIKPNKVVPAQSQEQVDDMLTESMALQYTQVNDFLDELRNNHSEKPEIIQYGTLMKHLQSECVFHLSALAAGAILLLQQERNLREKEVSDAYQQGVQEGMGL